MYGDNREHLHNLYLPIQKCVEWFWNDKNDDITYMFNNAVIGLKMLKSAYSEYATIQHTLDYYIIILMQKNANLIEKLGITSLDIEKITSYLILGDSKDTQSANHNTLDKVINSQPTKMNIIQEPLVDNTNSNKQNNKNKNKLDTKLDNKLDNKIEEKKEPLLELHLDSKEEHRAKDDKDEHMIHKNLKDMHKFLFELWNIREIGIVINLYKEMETKQKGYERDNIYSNIMSYCSMKENKLYQYIEANSSIL